MDLPKGYLIKLQSQIKGRDYSVSYTNEFMVSNGFLGYVLPNLMFLNCRVANSNLNTTILVYIDDFIIAGSRPSSTTATKTYLKSQFKLKDLTGIL